MRKTVILTVKGLLLIFHVVLPYLGSPLTQFCVQLFQNNVQQIFVLGTVLQKAALHIFVAY